MAADVNAILGDRHEAEAFLILRRHRQDAI
jgi:hypothetical protein